MASTPVRGEREEQRPLAGVEVARERGRIETEQRSEAAELPRCHAAS